jgi:hypothetical protein
MGAEADLSYLLKEIHRLRVFENVVMRKIFQLQGK